MKTTLLIYLKAKSRSCPPVHLFLLANIICNILFKIKLYKIGLYRRLYIIQLPIYCFPSFLEIYAIHLNYVYWHLYYGVGLVGSVYIKSCSCWFSVQMLFLESIRSLSYSDVLFSNERYWNKPLLQEEKWVLEYYVDRKEFVFRMWSNLC